MRPPAEDKGSRSSISGSELQAPKLSATYTQFGSEALTLSPEPGCSQEWNFVLENEVAEFRGLGAKRAPGLELLRPVLIFSGPVEEASKQKHIEPDFTSLELHQIVQTQCPRHGHMT